jgi:membrane protease YdiL (CAAX protease family)
MWLAGLLAGLLLLGHAWGLALLVAALIGLRAWDYRLTAQLDAAATGPRPGRCVATTELWAPVRLDQAAEIARLALDRVAPRWSALAGGPDRVRARLRGDRNRAQLVSLWLHAGSGGTVTVVEVRPQRSSLLYDQGATTVTAARVRDTIAEVVATGGVLARPGPPAPPAPPEPLVGWRWWHVLAAVVIFKLAGYVLVWTDIALGKPLRGDAFLVVGQLCVWGCVLGWLAFVSATRGHRSFRRDYGLELRLPEDLFIGALLAPGILVLQGLMVGILQAITGVHAASTSQILVDDRHRWIFWVLIVFAVVGAPFVEELAFRGLTLRGLERRVSPMWAVVLSGLIFGSLHWIVGSSIPANLILVTTLAGSGMVLGAIAVAARRLGPSMIAHGTLNLIISVVVIVRYH